MDELNKLLLSLSDHERLVILNQLFSLMDHERLIRFRRKAQKKDFAESAALLDKLIKIHKDQD
jgi:hypothetical protein